MSNETKINALAKLLNIEPDDIAETHDDCNFEVEPSRKKTGTSPTQAKALTALVRKALQIAVDAIPAGDPKAMRIEDRLPTQIVVLKRDGETQYPVRFLSRDTSTWTSADLDDAFLLAKAVKDGNTTLVSKQVIPTYHALVSLIRETCNELTKIGIHDLVNSLYFLFPDSETEDGRYDSHKATLREAFDGQTPTDRRDIMSCNGGEYMVLTDDEASEAWETSLDNYLDDCVEAAGEPYFDREAWKRDARVDGRGHFLSGYDGNERTAKNDGELFYVYRTN